MTVLHENAELGRASAGGLTPDAPGAIDFLERWMDGAEPRSLLVSIIPDSPTTRGQTFALPGDDAVARWIERCNRVAGIYWTVNACRPDLAKKATKADVEWLLGIWGDLDPLKGCDPVAERERLFRLADELMALPWPPTVIIDSGGGIQPLWRLETPLEAAAEFRQAIECLGRRIEAALGGVENTCNIDRVLRLPFTVNHPNRLKVEQGRMPVMSGILAETSRRYSWRDLEALAAHLEDEPVANATPAAFRSRPGNGAAAAGSYDGNWPPLPDYPTDEQVEALLDNHPNLQPIWNQTTPYPPEDTSPSGWDQSFASTLAVLGFPPERIASYLRAYRAHHCPDKGKQDRTDYIWRTVHYAEPADACLGEAQEAGGEQGECPPEDTPPHEAGQSGGAGGSNGPGQYQTTGDSQGRNRGAFKTGSAQDQGSWPEPGELGKMLPAPPFPTQFLPQTMRQWVEAQAENMAVQPDFLAIPSIVTMAGCIGRDIVLRVKRRDWEWVERPCIWGLVIAPPGTMKSPAQQQATMPLRAAEAEQRERWKEQVAAWEGRQVKGKDGKVKLRDDDPKPIEPKLMTSDTTIEALADMMVESHGMTLVADELSGWVDNMGRYNSGNDRQFYLKCHSGGQHNVDRVIRGRQIVTDCYMSVIGGIQPQVASRAFSTSAEHKDDGFLQRFGLIGYPDIPAWQGVVDREPDRDFKNLMIAAGKRLAAMDWRHDARFGGSPLVFLNDAQDCFLGWYDRHMRDHVAFPGAEKRPDHGFMSKGPGLVARLSIVFHLFRWTCGEDVQPGSIGVDSLQPAISLFERYCKASYARALSAFAKVKGETGAERVGELIVRQKLARIRISDITKMNWVGLRERADIERAFSVLEDNDWLSPPLPAKGLVRQRGRPSEAWEVNPRVHKMPHNFGAQK
jgi:hypothetical protein